MSKWCYSLCGHNYYGVFDTKEEAIKEGETEAREYEKDSFFVARAVFTFKPHIDAENVIEEIQQNAYDNGGEYAETYLDDVKREHRDELEEKLNEVLSNWINKYGYTPDFYSVEDVETYRLN